MKTLLLFLNTKFYSTAQRLTLLFLICLQVRVVAQSPVVIYAPQSNNLAAGFFIPNSTASLAYSRAAFFIHRQELAPYANSSITSFSIPIVNNTNTVATVGNFTLYFQNTLNNRIWLPWNFSNAIFGMTTVYAGTLAIPAAGTSFITVNLQTPFLYTGAGMHLAYSWENAGPYTSTGVNAVCTDLFTGLENYGEQYWTMFSNSSLSPPPTIGGYTAWRPAFRFGANKLYSNDAYIVDAHAPGKILSSGNSESTVVFIGNSGTSSAQNVSVSMVSGGDNSYSATQVIPSLAPSSTQSLAFNGFAPTLSGLNTITLSILNADQDLTNNSVVLNQSVTCNEVSAGYLNGQFGGAYFGNGIPAILALPFSTPVTRTLTAIKLKVSNYSNSGNVAVSGVLTNATGSIIATTATVIANSAALLTMPFTTPFVMTPGLNYFYGVEVLTGNAYPIAADISFPLTPAQAFEIPIGGGTPVPLSDDMGNVYGITALFNYVPPVITTTGNKYSCSGSSVTLSATSATGYSWTTGATTNSITVSPVTTNTYYVRTFNSQCNTNASVAVFVSPIPSPSIVGSNTLCEGSTKIYNAVGAWSYTWSSGMVSAQDVIMGGAAGAQIISLSAMNVPCAPVTATFQVQVKAAPKLQIVSPYLTLCNSAVGGKTLQLSGQPLGGVFSGTNVSPSGIVTPGNNGLITAFYSYTNAVNSCSASTLLELPVSSCLGFEGTDATAGRIHVFPNPSADGLFQIQCDDLTELRLLSLDGKNLPVLRPANHLLDARELPPGIYLLEVSTAQAFYRIKLVRE